MDNNKKFLGTEPVGKLLFKLAVPTVLAQLVNMLYNIVDRIYIGHMEGIGDLALTGVGICLPIIMIVSAFAALIGTGGAPRASIFMGKGEPEKAEKTLGGCFVLQIIISVVLTAVLLIWNRDFLMMFGGSENTIEYAVSYMNIYALGTIFVQLTLGMNAFITAQGFTRISMVSVMIGAILNIILDPIFIFALGLDVRGAALATAISQAASCAWVLKFLFGKKTVLKIRPENLRIIPSVVLPCLGLGTASFIMQASESIITMCFNSSLQMYGGDIAVGAMTILSSIIQFAMLPLQGLGQGAQPITSYNYGAGNKDRVRKSFFSLLRASVVYSVLLWILVMLFPRVFAGIFAGTPELLDFTARVLPVFCGAMCLFGVQMACQMTFVAIGSAKVSAIVAIVRKFVLLLPFIYIMPQIFSDKTLGVYAAEPAADVIAVSFTAILFAFQFRKTLGKLDGKEITPGT